MWGRFSRLVPLGMLASLASAALACYTIHSMGELASDGTPIEFTGADEVEYIWRASVEPGKEYEVVLTHPVYSHMTASITVCDRPLDKVEYSGMCSDNILVHHNEISEDHRARFMAPEDGDVVIVIDGIFGLEPVDGYVVTLTSLASSSGGE